MTIGAGQIADLRLTRLQKLITRFMRSPQLLLLNLFGSNNWDSDNIEWESQIGNRGLTPFVPPGAPAPQTAPTGVAKHSAFAAYWKEKMYFDEVFLNNLRQAGTVATYERTQRRLARELLGLRTRSDRRAEWMLAKMLTAGSFEYKEQGGTKISVDYGIPSSQIVTLAASRLWSTGESKNIIEDIMDAKLAVDVEFSHAMFTADVLKYMVLDTGIQTLLQKSAFGQGDLFSRPAQVLGSLLDIPTMVKYDEKYQIRAWLTAAVTASSTTQVYVDDVTDFEVGGTLRFYDTSAQTYEDETIASVTPESGIVTVSSAPATSYKASEDFVYMTKKFLPTNAFCMFAANVEGQMSAEFAYAPFGNDRVWGMKVDSKENWDPEGIFIRVQNKGLPILYHADAPYIMTVA